MAYSVPTSDYLTTTLSGAITGVATSATVAAGLNLPATNGILQIDYDSSTAVGSDNGPETIGYATYVTGTGALTGLTRGLANTSNGTLGVGVAHINTAHVMSGMSAVYLAQSPRYDTWNAAGTLTYATVDGPTQTATITGDSTASLYPGVRMKFDQVQAIQNYWSFDTNSADSKGSATMANIGTPTYTAGKFSNALTLDGSTQALSITDAATLKPTDNFTIGVWFKTSNTGAEKYLFQSYSVNPTNEAGIKIGITAGNVLFAQTGQNTSASSYVGVTGTTTVTDGNWHYAVWSFRNNYTQVYLDGKLEVSGYTPAPAYGASNLLRIGCKSSSGANSSWFNGQIDDLFIAAYALDEQTIAAKYAAATAQGTGDLTLTKYALVTASSYSNPNTTVTIYSGTDYTMMNATVSNAYYSTQKAPYGFPLNPDKWKVEVSSSLDTNQATALAGTWYNIGGSISVPIGLWSLEYFAPLFGNRNSTTAQVVATLSTANNSQSEFRLTTYLQSNWVGTGVGTIASTVTAKINKSMAAKSSYYLNATCVGGTHDFIAFKGSQSPTIIRATSTLL